MRRACLGLLSGLWLASCGTMHAPQEFALGPPRRFEPVDVKIAWGSDTSASPDGVGAMLDDDTIGLLMAEAISAKLAGSTERGGSPHKIEYGVAVEPRHRRQRSGAGGNAKPAVALRGTCIVVPGILGEHSASHLVDALCRDDWAVLVVWPPLVGRAKEAMDATRGQPLAERGTALGSAIDELLGSTADVARYQLVSLQSGFPDLRGKPVLFVGESMGAIAGVGIAATGRIPYDAALFVAGGGGFLDVASQTALRGMLFAGLPIDDQAFIDAFGAACRLDPLCAAASLRGGPIALVTASNDAVVPTATQESLWRALGEPPRFVWEGGHLELFGSGDRTIVPIARRLTEMVGERSRAAEVLYRLEVERGPAAAAE